MNPQLIHGFDKPQLPLILVVDFSNIMYRNYHALKAQKRSFNAPDGTPTGALMLSINKIEKALTDTGADHVLIVQEGGGKQARQTVFADYKSDRVSADEDLKTQMKLALEIFPMCGFSLLKEPQLEADDVMVGIAHAGEKFGYNTALMTSDKDMYQAIGPYSGILPVDFKDPKLIDTQGCISKFGVPPQQIVDYLSLLGDSVDQIPGVPSIGDKTAVKLLKEYNNLENILDLAQSGKLSEKLNTLFTRYQEQALMSKSLANAMHYTPKIPFTFSPPQWDELYENLTRLGFKSTLSTLKKRQKNFTLPSSSLFSHSLTSEPIISNPIVSKPQQLKLF